MVADLDFAAVTSDPESVNARVIDLGSVNCAAEPEKRGESRNNEDKNEKENKHKNETSLLKHFQTATKILRRFNLGVLLMSRLLFVA